jgi:hypothetical protein
MSKRNRAGKGFTRFGEPVDQPQFRHAGCRPGFTGEGQLHRQVVGDAFRQPEQASTHRYERPRGFRYAHICGT